MLPSARLSPKIKHGERRRGERKRRRSYVRGTTKWFSLDKQFGFILPDDGGPDVFVHLTALQAAGLRDLHEGQEIEFDTVRSREGKLARPGALGQRPGRALRSSFRDTAQVPCFAWRAGSRGLRRLLRRATPENRQFSFRGLPLAPGSPRRRFCFERLIRRRPILGGRLFAEMLAAFTHKVGRLSARRRGSRLASSLAGANASCCPSRRPPVRYFRSALPNGNRGSSWGCFSGLADRRWRPHLCSGSM